MEERMKPIAMPGLLSLTLLIPDPMARADGIPTTLFKCAVGKKTVSVTRTGDQITYHYGTGGKDEMAITGTPGNIFQMSQRYAGMEYQLRFKNGDTSYIVYNSEGNGNSGARATSGLMIMQGTSQISDKSCARYTEFTVSIGSLGIPQDTDTYSAL
jgi:hypothetical protein